MSDFVSGMIIMWSGEVKNIPSGWVFCDGTNNTPDLRDRFIIGAGRSYNPGDSGEPDMHSHSIPQMNVNISPDGTHHHLREENWYENAAASGDSVTVVDRNQTNRPWYTSTVDNHTHPGSHTDNYTTAPDWSDNKPRWYALAFIMKTPYPY